MYIENTKKLPRISENLLNHRRTISWHLQAPEARSLMEFQCFQSCLLDLVAVFPIPVSRFARS